MLDAVSLIKIMKAIRIYLISLGLVMMLSLTACQNNYHMSTFKNNAPLTADHVARDEASLVLCEKRIFSDAEFEAMIASMVGDDYSLYQQDSSFLQEEISTDTTQVPQGKPVSIKDLPINKVSELLLVDHNEDVHAITIEREGDFIAYYRNKKMLVLGQDMCAYNLLRTDDSDEKQFLEWAFPKEANTSKGTAFSRATTFINENNINLSLFFAEPCTVISENEILSYGWKFIFTKQINGLQSRFEDGQWYYINPEYPPVAAAPWDSEFCVIVIDDIGLCQFFWEGASTDREQLTAPLFSDAEKLNDCIEEKVKEVFASGIPSEKDKIDIQITDVCLGLSLLSHDKYGGQYVPSWYVSLRYKWNSSEDQEKNWEYDTIIFNAINGDYIEPRVTEEKLKRIVEEAENEK